MLSADFVPKLRDYHQIRASVGCEPPPIRKYEIYLKIFLVPLLCKGMPARTLRVLQRKMSELNRGRLASKNMASGQPQGIAPTFTATRIK